MKWYVKLLIGLLVVVFSPLILVMLIVAVLGYISALPKLIKEYKSSSYYKEFELPFKQFRVNSPEYRFFNAYKARGLQLDYIRQHSNGFEYFIYNGTLFIFPDFEQICFDDEKSEWEVDYDGDWKNFESAYGDITSRMDSDIHDMPIKILVEREMITLTDLNGISIPECIYLTWSYENAFENDESRLILKVPTNTQELYDMMLDNPDICGGFRITEKGNILWDLYDDIQIDISVDPQDCYLGVSKKFKGKVICGITHWHPNNFEIYNEVRKIGLKGNVLVISSTGSVSSVLYIGDEKTCPYSSDDKFFFKKFYYLKAN